MTKKQKAAERRLMKIILVNLIVCIVVYLLNLPGFLGSFLAGLSIGLSTRIK